MLASTHFTTAAASRAPRDRAVGAASTRRPAQRRTKRSGSVWAVAVLLACGWTAYAAPAVRRPALVALRPLLDVLVPAEPQIKFGEVRARRLQVDGQTVLYVEGVLKNTGKGLRKTPALRVTLLGDDDQPLYTWKSKAAKAEIEPSREVNFQTRLLSPPEKFKNIAISLGAEG